MRLDCYLFEGKELDIRPADARRDWMDATFRRFAYRCLPLSIANAHGWTLHCKSSFEVEWDGGEAPDAVKVFASGDERADAQGHFGSGILTFDNHAMFRTDPGYNLWISGPPNRFKDGIQGLSAVVETDWMPFSFTMNWKITRPHHRIRFERGEPYCFLFPVQRGVLETVEPKLRNLSEDAESERQVTYARNKRGFLQMVEKIQKSAGKTITKPDRKEEATLKFQKWYMRGQMPDGSNQFDEHQTSLELKPFEDERSDPPAIQ